MKKQLIILGVSVLLICVGLTGCFESSSDDTSKFIGSWKFINRNHNFSETWTFYENKTLKCAWIYRDGEKTGLRWANYEIFLYGKIDITFLNTSDYYDYDNDFRSYVNLSIDYAFSDNNKRLTLIYNQGSPNRFEHVLIKQ